MKIKNKKAIDFLGGHVINIIIAAICVIFLIILGAGIFNIFTEERIAEGKARAELGKMMEIISALQKSGTDGSASDIVLGPEGWAIVGWPLNLNPKYCVDQGWDQCLCFCDVGISGTGRAKGWVLTENRVKEACDSRPVCARINVKEFYVNPLENRFTNFLGININKRPIILAELGKTYIEKIEISYDKKLDRITIAPKDK